MQDPKQLTKELDSEFRYNFLNLKNNFEDYWVPAFAGMTKEEAGMT